MHVQLKWRLTHSDFLPKDIQQNSDISGPVVSLWACVGSTELEKPVKLMFYMKLFVGSPLNTCYFLG